MKRSEKLELLNQYSEFLMREGYLDTDWKDEHPTAIDEFIKSVGGGGAGDDPD